jgi:hypothetical protein
MINFGLRFPATEMPAGPDTKEMFGIKNDSCTQLRGRCNRKKRPAALTTGLIIYKTTEDHHDGFEYSCTTHGVYRHGANGNRNMGD